MAAKLSRYSYLVSLLPDQILKELELDFVTLSRKVSSYTPVGDSGVLVMREFDQASGASIDSIAKNPQESINWQAFYSRVAVLAEKLAPTLLEPLRTPAEIKKTIGEDLWNEFIASPISETLARNFNNDVIRGIVLTDGVIGTFTSASEAAANICFLYHLIGNGNGEWRVPKGGMGKLVEALTNRCKSLGVDLRCNADVTRISETSEGV